MFRTQTGQTGKDAYVYEATAIANAKRALDAKMQALVKTVREESPQMFRDSTDFHWSHSEDAEHFAAYIGKSHEEYVKWLRGR